MRKTMLSIAALGAALVAVPAMAQSYGYPGQYGGGYGQYGNGYGQQGYSYYGGNRYMVPAPWQVRQMIDQAARNGEISRYELRRLYGDARDLDRLYSRAQRGDDYGARREWQRRTFEVLRELREARNDGDRYGDRYHDRDHDGYSDRDDRYDNDPYRR